jgi:predicted kinase
MNAIATTESAHPAVVETGTHDGGYANMFGALGQTGEVLVIMSGLPGVGKSTLAQGIAQLLGAVVVAVDPIEDAIVRSGIPMSLATGVAAYEVAAAIALAQLRNGLVVIADAANYVEVGRDVWRRTAAEAQVPIKVIEVICSDPALHRHRLAARQRGLTAFPEPSWEDVEQRRVEIEPWDEERLVVDSAESFESGIKSAAIYLSVQPASSERLWSSAG